MDGIILQLKGSKKWTIYDPPFALFPRPDHIRRPTPEFLKYAKDNEPQEFVLSAGDMVYIPRGVVHEATTNFTEKDDDTAAAAAAAADAEEKDKENNKADDKSPSLHLTYGLETATHYTTEVSPEPPCMYIHNNIITCGYTHFLLMNRYYCITLSCRDLLSWVMFLFFNGSEESQARTVPRTLH
jgi:hypothetical protein